MKEQTVPLSPLDWKSPAYVADGYFEWVSSLKILKNRPVRQEIPNLDEVLASYREVIQKCSSTFFITKGQNFSTRVHLDPPGNYYDVSWDIERLKETVREKKLKPFLVPVKKPINDDLHHAIPI